MRPGDIPSVDCTSPIKKLIKANFISKKKNKMIKLLKKKFLIV